MVLCSREAPSSQCVCVTSMRIVQCLETNNSARKEGPNYLPILHLSGAVFPSIYCAGAHVCSSGQPTTFTTRLLSTCTCKNRLERHTGELCLLSRLWKMSGTVHSRKETIWYWEQFATTLTQLCLSFWELVTTKKTSSSATTEALQWETTTTADSAQEDSGTWNQTDAQKTKGTWLVSRKSPLMDERFLFFVLYLS